jgi:hypothetical protein
MHEKKMSLGTCIIYPGHVRSGETFEIVNIEDTIPPIDGVKAFSVAISDGRIMMLSRILDIDGRISEAWNNRESK